MRRFLLVLWTLLACASLAHAQNQTGQIFGQVTDPSGAVMAGVRVTLSGPAILQPMEVTTSNAGSYIFPGIPIGTYSVKFDATGYRPFLRESIRIDIGFNAEVNATLSIASVEQSVEVSAATPVIDTQSAAQSTELDQQNLQDLPVARTYYNEVELSTGAVEAAKDVGGAQNLNSPSFSALGSNLNQAMYYYDGAHIAEAGSSANMWVDYNSIQEIRVIDGGADATVQTSGPAVIMVTKSGSDRFHGSIYDYEEGQSFEADNIGNGAFRQALASTQPEASAGNPLTHFRNFGGDIGGPIKKGKAWFYADWGDNGIWVGADHVYQSTPSCAGVAANQLNYSWGQVRSCELAIPTFIKGQLYKVAWTPFHNNNFTFTNEYSNKEVYYNGLTPLVALSSTRPQNAACGSHWHWGGVPDYGVRQPPFLWDCGWPTLWKWDDQQVIGDRLVVDTWYIHWAKRNQMTVLPNTFGVAEQVEQSSGAVQASSALNAEFEPMNNFHVAPTYSVPSLWGGNHTFKAAYNWVRYDNYFEQNQDAEAEEIYSSGTAAPFSVPFAVEFFRPGYANAFLNEQNAFVQDTYTRKRWTLNLGIRWDHQTDNERGFNVPASPYEGQTTANGAIFNWLPAVNFPGSQGGVAWNTFAPRLGVVYDLFGTTKTVLKASYAQYFDQRTEGMLADTYNTISTAGAAGASQSFIEFPWGGATANGVPLLNGPIVNGKNTGVNATPWVSGAALNTYNYITYGNHFNPNNPATTVSVNSVDPNIKDPKTNEITAGISQELGPGFAVSVTYTYRRYTDFIWQHINGITSANYVPCMTSPTVTTTCAPGGGVAPTTLKATVCPTTVAPNAPTVCPAVTYFAPNTTLPPAYTLENQPDYHISYQGVMIQARKVMTKNWMLNATLTIQSTRQYWTAPDAYQDPTNIAIENGAQYAPLALPGGGFGINVPVNARWNSRIGGLYKLKWWGVELGASADLSQGFPILSAINVSSRPGGASSVAVLIAPPGSQRYNAVQNLAVRVDRTFVIRDRFDIQPSLDIFNVLNSNTFLFQQPNQNSANANFIGYALGPRVARIGIKASF